jgi:hypothetical protein
VTLRYFKDRWLLQFILVASSPGAPIFSTYTRERGGAWYTKSRERRRVTIARRWVLFAMARLGESDWVRHYVYQPRAYFSLCTYSCWNVPVKILWRGAHAWLRVPGSPVSLACVEKIWAPGDEAIILVFMTLACECMPATVLHSSTSYLAVVWIE